MNNTFFLNVMTLEEIIDFFLPYFRDLHINENYMDTQPNHENPLMNNLSCTGTQMLVKGILLYLSLTHTYGTCAKKDNDINPNMGTAHFLMCKSKC